MEIEFEYDSVDGRELKILGHSNGEETYFKVYQNNKKISRSSLTTMDVENIIEAIKEHSQEEYD